MDAPVAIAHSAAQLWVAADVGIASLSPRSRTLLRWADGHTVLSAPQRSLARDHAFGTSLCRSSIEP